MASKVHTRLHLQTKPCLSKMATLLLFLCFLFTSFSYAAEARNCHRVWNCKGDIRCWEDCKNEHNGKGLCDLYTAPSVPKQCFCAYKC
ncbi:putative defensin-like protein 184 isoform X1 [Cucurbita moschata]|uniref:Defensin-like protein 184 isoform X1 n=1 Tax=Cucurbita moschata TaxID=3662 RepID=A0A6J1F2J5_CUCMO|nr:putative defensin-like protein 184 isoform X1 [Cucurbita moschata]